MKTRAAGRVDGLHVPELLVGRPPHHEHEHVVLPRRGVALPASERIRGLLQLPPGHAVQHAVQVGLVLGVNVLHPLEVLGEGVGELLEHAFVLEQVSAAHGDTSVLHHLVDELYLRFTDAVLSKVFFHPLQRGRVGLIPQRKQQHQTQTLHVGDGGALQPLSYRVTLLLTCLRTSQFLLYARHGHEVVLLHQPRQLMHHSNVLGHIAGELAKLGVIIHKPLHVLDGFDLAGVGSLLLVLLDVHTDVGPQVAEIGESIIAIEGILLW
mmetsp:Transcript_58718/g.156973  ORF Transcript_58718/g.156973 Transcript_58718/m.156973 type:complete len:266 (+) Transcript_58718:88-885(+)